MISCLFSIQAFFLTIFLLHECIHTHTHTHTSVFPTLKINMKDGFLGRNGRALGNQIMPRLIIQAWTVVAVEGIENTGKFNSYSGGALIKDLSDWLIHYLMEWVRKEKGDDLRMMFRLQTRGTGWMMFPWMANTTLRVRGCLLFYFHTCLSHVWASCRHPGNLDIALSVTGNSGSLSIRGVAWNKLFLMQITWFIARQDRWLPHIHSGLVIFKTFHWTNMASSFAERMAILGCKVVTIEKVQKQTKLLCWLSNLMRTEATQIPQGRVLINLIMIQSSDSFVSLSAWGGIPHEVCPLLSLHTSSS